jgi:NAD(P)-dependent dehydrogenase (short-subunit alcohol dehydrogenase family)
METPPTPPMHTLAGRVAVVTGAAGGLGLGLARTLGAAGMRLVLADIDAAALQEAAEDLRTEVEAVAAVPTDVRDEDQVDRLAKQAVATFGRVDLLVNNAGDLGPLTGVWTLGYQWETPLADWRWVVDVNFWGRARRPRLCAPAARQPGRRPRHQRRLHGRDPRRRLQWPLRGHQARRRRAGTAVALTSGNIVGAGTTAAGTVLGAESDDDSSSPHTYLFKAQAEL